MGLAYVFVPLDFKPRAAAPGPDGPGTPAGQRRHAVRVPTAATGRPRILDVPDPDPPRHRLPEYAGRDSKPAANAPLCILPQQRLPGLSGRQALPERGGNECRLLP